MKYTCGNALKNTVFLVEYSKSSMILYGHIMDIFYHITLNHLFY